MNVAVVVALALLFIAVGVAHVKGCGYAKKHLRGHLVQFYIALSGVRLLIVATAAAACILTADSRRQALYYAATVMGMYIVMMTVTLIIKH